MPRYWIIAPYEYSSKDSEKWERVWQYDLDNGLISIGYSRPGNISGYNESELRAAIESTYNDDKPGKKTSIFTMLWAFYHDIQPGDIIIARRGRKKIAAKGTVTRSAYYAEIESPDKYPNHIGVRWDDIPRDKEFPRIVFGMQALYEIDTAKYNQLVEEPPTSTSELVEEGIENRTEFVLEKYLEDFLVSNFDTIFKGKLILYRDPEENVTGQQYATDVGTIDILAQEPRTNSFMVVELKKGRESDKVIGQTLRYMGWVRDNLCQEGQSVKGMIICREADLRLNYALRMTSDIVVKYYQVDFRLTD